MDLWRLLQETARHSMRCGRCDAVEVLFGIFSVAMRDIAVLLSVPCFYSVFCVCCSCSCGGVYLLVLHPRFCSSVLKGVSMDGFGLF